MTQPRQSEVAIPHDSLVILCGPAGCGKSTWAEKNFSADAIVSSDRCRYMISGDEHDQSVTKPAFELFYSIIEKRLEAGKITCADSTALHKEHRKITVEMAKKHGRDAILVNFCVDDEVVRSRNAERPRPVPAHVVEKHLKRKERANRDIGEEFARERIDDSRWYRGIVLVTENNEPEIRLVKE